MKKYAIFFPQFHEVKVNNNAWGKGFTDWALIATANAFEYWERRAPACGFYDLSEDESIKARFHEASEYGLEGFGIYHYRFDDGPELDAVERFLKNNKLPDGFGYFYIWANENWSKRWAGNDTDLLKVASTIPSREEIRDHVAYLKAFMQQENYTKLDGRPLFVIYRPDFFADPQSTISSYRQEFEDVGINPAIGFFLKSTSDVDYSDLFDFCYLFEPRLFQNFNGLRKSRLVHSVARWLMRTISYSRVEYLSELIGKYLIKSKQSRSFLNFVEYFNSPQRKKMLVSLKCPVQNVLTSGWNNAPRYRERFVEIVKVPSQEQFSSIVSDAISDPDCTSKIPLLCNAWNEWSEGAAIEPCYYLGDSLLKAYLGNNYRKNNSEY